MPKPYAMKYLSLLEILLFFFFSRKKNGTTHDILPAHSLHGDVPPPGKIAKVRPSGGRKSKHKSPPCANFAVVSGFVRGADYGEIPPRALPASECMNALDAPHALTL